MAIYRAFYYTIIVMKSVRRTTFYPISEVAKALGGAPPKKVSERINELIVKGLAKEEEDRIRADYERYARELSSTPPRKKDKKGMTAAMAMAAGLFSADDEPEDWF